MYGKYVLFSGWSEADDAPIYTTYTTHRMTVEDYRNLLVINAKGEQYRSGCDPMDTRRANAAGKMIGGHNGMRRGWFEREYYIYPYVRTTNKVELARQVAEFIDKTPDTQLDVDDEDMIGVQWDMQYTRNDQGEITSMKRVWHIDDDMQFFGPGLLSDKEFRDQEIAKELGEFGEFGERARQYLESAHDEDEIYKLDTIDPVLDCLNQLDFAEHRLDRESGHVLADFALMKLLQRTLNEDDYAMVERAYHSIGKWYA
jgi:hypothetical protein